MSLRINLLKKSEQRYQGIVSMKVMVLGSAGVLAGVTVLVLALAGISRMTLNANLDRARREYQRIEPQAERLRSRTAATAANRKMLARLDSWGQGDYLSMYGLLRSVQSRVPPQMMVENMFAGLEQAADSESRYYTLRITGRVQGELTAVEAKRQLSTGPQVRAFCGEVKLVSSQRESGESWLFSLEGRRQEQGDAKK